jgi:hypothetical protein
VEPNPRFNVGIEGVDIEATAAIPESVTIVILGTTVIAGSDDIEITGGDGIFVYEGGTLTITAGNAGGEAGKTVTVTTPVTVASGGSLAVNGGVGSSSAAVIGGAATVEKVTAQAGSTITVTAGAGGTNASGTGGNAVIGSASEAGKKIAFEAGGTITVGVTGGAAANEGAGGDAELYTSNSILSESNSTAANAVIDGVTLTAVGGANDGGGGGNAVVDIDEDDKSIVAPGGIHS